MKRKKILTIAIIIFGGISLFNGTIPENASAGEYVGDFCWEFFRKTPEVSGTLQLGVYHIGGGHFICSGLFKVTAPISIERPVYGNAEYVGEEIFLTLSLAGVRNGVIGSDTMRANLNPENLSGPFEYIGIYFDAVEISEGSLTYINCK